MSTVSRGTLVAVCAVVFVLGSRPATIHGDTPQLIVAAVRDHRILPIARLNGTTWLNTWLTPIEGAWAALPVDRIPETWLGGPVPPSWQTWSAAGSRLGSLRVTSTVALNGGGCGEALDLVVDGPVVAYAALALAGDRRLEPVPMTSVQSVSPPIRNVIADLLTARQGAIVNADQGARSPVDRSKLENAIARATPTFAVFTGVRTTDGGHVWFFAVRKSSHVDAGAFGERGIHMEGWLRQDSSGNVLVLEAEGVVIGGDSARDTRPLGVIRLNGRDYWFLDRRYYEGAEFLTVEVTALGVRQLLAASAGGC